MNKKYYGIIIILAGVIAVAISVIFKPSTKPLQQCDQPLIGKPRKKEWTGKNSPSYPFLILISSTSIYEAFR